MQNSPLFSATAYHDIEKKVKDFLNKQHGFLSAQTADSPRAVGDAIASVIADNFQDIIGDIAIKYSSAFERRAMADLAFQDKHGFNYTIDVKTHRLDTKFNMPNLTSVERLSRFYKNDKNYFVILKIDYSFKNEKLVINAVTFVPIEFLSWDCLTIGALGWGQIQISDAKTVTIIPGNSRKRWMSDLCDILLEFYPKEVKKITSRVEYFKEVRQFWKSKK